MKKADAQYKALKDLGLSPRLKNPHKGKKDKNYIYDLEIYRKDDIKFFINKIGFKNSKHITKIQVFEKLGYCPPHTKIEQRKNILSKSSKDL